MNRKSIFNSIISVIIIVFMSIFSCAVFAGSKSKIEERLVIRFNHPSEDDIERFGTSGFDIAAYKPDVYLDIVTTMSNYNKWRAQGFDIEITQTESRLRSNLAARRREALDGYRDYGRLLSELQQIEQQYPNICKLYDIGDTWGKMLSNSGNDNYDKYIHEIWALKVSDNVAEEEDEPSIYYMGEHHAREPISLEVTMAILQHVLANYGTDSVITSNVNNTQIWFIPLLNPNGHKIVTDKQDVWWRKNIRDNNENGHFDFVGKSGNGPDGVDLNRNYGFQWGLTGASGDPNSQIYHGPESWSEPEVQAVKDFFESHHFIAGITYHSYGELVMYPYGYSDTAIVPDYGAILKLAIQMAEAIPGTEHEHGHYSPQAGWELYPSMGDHSDCAYGAYGIFSYTIELATEFIPPADNISSICNDNLDAAMILLNRPNYAILTGRITDLTTTEPVEAEIIIENIDDVYNDDTAFRNPYKSDHKFGRYYRLLEDGNYKVSFRAEGYKTVTKENIQIRSTEQTVLDIVMEENDSSMASSAESGSGSCFIEITTSIE